MYSSIAVNLYIIVFVTLLIVSSVNMVYEQKNNPRIASERQNDS